MRRTYTFFLSLCGFLLMNITAFGQCPEPSYTQGPTFVYSGQSANYGLGVTGYTCNIDFVSGANVGNSYNGNTVTWGSPSVATDYIINFDCGACSLNSYFISVRVDPNPPAPPSGSINEPSGCGSKTLTKNGSPPPGVTWHWQTSSTGTTTNSSSSYIVNSTGWYYLRSRTAAGDWGSALGEYVTITPNLQAGSISMPSSVCYDATLSGSNVQSATGGGGFVYQWQRNNVDIPQATGSTYSDP
ncbi:MAG: hypothetical protein RIC80_02580, partial [Cyclobacteriaceae bacterium]